MAFNLRKPPKLTPKHEAYPFQVDAMQAIKDLTYAAVFHEQGLGKTKIAIDLSLYWLEYDIVDTVFIVTKKTLVQNWIDELGAHSHITPRVLSSNQRDNSIALNSPVLVYVMNYEILSANLEILKMFLLTCRVGAILDESQKIKNPEGKLTCNFLAIASSFSRRVIMTGTPVANRPYDIWSQIKFLDGGESLGQSFQNFKHEMDLPSSPGKTVSYEEALSRIKQCLQGFTIRETKQSSGLELPGKTIVSHFSELEYRQREIYENYRNNLSHEIGSDENLIEDNAEAILKLLLRLVQCASNPILIDKTYEAIPCKFLKLQEILNSADAQAGKFIVWTSFVDNVNWLSKKLTDYNPAKVHGRLTITDRNRAITRFKQDDSCRILVATPGSAKEGLTLTVANQAVFYDRSFSLDDYLQAQDRIHRISQNRECYVHNLIARHTVDEWVDSLLYVKHQAAQIVQGDMVEPPPNKAINWDLSTVLKDILHPGQG